MLKYALLHGKAHKVHSAFTNRTEILRIVLYSMENNFPKMILHEVNGSYEYSSIYDSQTGCGVYL